MQVAERPLGVFSRQLFLGDTLDTDHIDAGYDAGVLTLRIPIAEKAKPRKISITQLRPRPQGDQRLTQVRDPRPALHVPQGRACGPANGSHHRSTGSGTTPEADGSHDVVTRERGPRRYADGGALDVPAAHTRQPDQVVPPASRTSPSSSAIRA